MTTFDQPPIDFDAVSAPISGETKATVELVGNDPNADRDWEMFKEVVERDAWSNDGKVSPNRVRNRLSNRFGLTIEPRRYSAFWSRAAGKSGFLDADGWTTNDDVKGGNRGKPQRMYRLRVSS
jgi:hypothetical protein